MSGSPILINEKKINIIHFLFCCNLVLVFLYSLDLLSCQFKFKRQPCHDLEDAKFSVYLVHEPADFL